MEICRECGVELPPIGNQYRCRTCKQVYDRAWRERRRAEGKRANGGIVSAEKQREYRSIYYRRQEAKDRRAASMRRYARGDLRDHHLARWKVARAVACGQLERLPCEVCGTAKTEAHHDDYSKPLDVRWLCQPHHRAHHRALAETPSPEPAKDVEKRTVSAEVIAFPTRTADDVMTKVLRENLHFGLALSVVGCWVKMHDDGLISKDGALDFIREAVGQANAAVKP